MNETNISTTSLATPQFAAEEYIGEQFMDWFSSFVSREVANWPITVKIKSAKPKPEKLKKFMLQIFLSQDAFLGAREGDPGFLRFAIANLSESDDPQAESALEILEKRRTDELIGHKLEKEIVKTLKREQWVGLLGALGLAMDEIERAELKEPTRNYIAELSDVYSTFDWQTAVGALAAHDIALSEQNKAILELLKQNLKINDKDAEVLGSNAQVLQSAVHILEKVVFDKEAKDLVWQGVMRQLEIRKEFLQGLEKYLD